MACGKEEEKYALIMSSRMNENDLVDIARRYGLDSLFEQVSRRNSNWTNTSVFFDNKCNDSDLNDDQQTFCYLCSINQHEHERTKPRDESQVLINSNIGGI